MVAQRKIHAEHAMVTVTKIVTARPVCFVFNGTTHHDIIPPGARLQAIATILITVVTPRLTRPGVGLFTTEQGGVEVEVVNVQSQHLQSQVGEDRLRQLWTG